MLQRFLLLLILASGSVAPAKQSAGVAACRNKLHGAASVLVIGGGSNGYLSESMIAGLSDAGETSFLTASRTEHEAWAGSQGHRSGIDRNNASNVAALLKEANPSVILDAAGAHMGDALQFDSIESAHAGGWAQAQMMIAYLSTHDRANLVFISSQYANPELKNPIPVERTFSVLGISKPVSVRLYAEMKAGYEDALLDYQRRTGRQNFVILRLGTLLSKGYRSESVLSMLKADEIPANKNFTPARVLATSLSTIFRNLAEDEALPRLLELSSRNDFADPKKLGLKTQPLKAYVDEVRSAWQ